MIQVSAGIVHSAGKVLAMKKGQSKYDYLSFKYEFPGGKIEAGESPLDALVREFSEELKADIRNLIIEHVCDTAYRYPDFSVTLHSFMITADEFPFTLTEHAGYRWVEPSELSGLDWADAEKDIVRELVKRL